MIGWDETKMNNNNDIGRIIRARREDAGLSQTQLAAQLGLKSPAVVNNWELGKNYPDISQITNICCELEISADELFGLQKSNDGKSNYVSKLDNDLVRMVSEALPIIDDRAKQDIKHCIAYNVQRCNPAEYTEIEYPVFLRMDTTDYAQIIAGAKDLHRMKRKSRKSYETIRKYLISVNPDFDELICLAYLVAIFNGEKCPSRQLYNLLFAFLSE